MSLDPTLVDYYSRRAAEYEHVYAKPERQADLARLATLVAERLRDRDVMEFACGTGYWTRVVAAEARSVWAVDRSVEMLAVARAKRWPDGRVQFVEGDVFAPPRPPRDCRGGFAGFWWSHLTAARLDAFLLAVRDVLAPGARLVCIDNRFVPGSSTPIARLDAEGNSYQRRTLGDGSTHEVLKNFPDETAVRRALRPHARDVEWLALDYYWLLSAELRPPAR